MNNAFFTMKREYRYERSESEEYIPDWAVTQSEEE